MVRVFIGVLALEKAVMAMALGRPPDTRARSRELVAVFDFFLKATVALVVCGSTEHRVANWMCLERAIGLARNFKGGDTRGGSAQGILNAYARDRVGSQEDVCAC